MSFNFNLNPNLSNVQASSKTTAGGGGNTGYFQRGKKEEENKEINCFTEAYPEDSFNLSTDEQEEQQETIISSILNFISGLIDSIKKAFVKK